MPRVYCQAHRFTNCCFCLNLKSGCRIIGILTTFVCSLELVSACHKLIVLLEQEKLCMKTDKWEVDDRNYLQICPHIKGVQFTLIIDFIIFVLGFNGSVLLLYGIKSKQPRLFLAWLVFASVVIFTSFISILIWHTKRVMSNLMVVLTLSYFFKVVRSYHQQLLEDMNNGCPVVAVAFPQESGMRMFVPAQHSQTASDYIKDDPPPPYPGLPVVYSSVSLESQPPPYASVSQNYNEQTSTTAQSSVSHENLNMVENGRVNEENSTNNEITNIAATSTNQNDLRDYKDDDAVTTTQNLDSPQFSEACSQIAVPESQVHMLKQDEELPGNSMKLQQTANTVLPENHKDLSETFNKDDDAVTTTQNLDSPQFPEACSQISVPKNQVYMLKQDEELPGNSMKLQQVANTVLHENHKDLSETLNKDDDAVTTTQNLDSPQFSEACSQISVPESHVQMLKQDEELPGNSMKLQQTANTVLPENHKDLSETLKDEKDES